MMVMLNGGMGSDVYGGGASREKQYPGLLHLLQDYIQHYSFKEVYFVVGSEDVEMVRAGLMLFKKATITTTNSIIDVTRDLHRLRSIVEAFPNRPLPDTAFQQGRSVNSQPDLNGVTVYTKPIFVSTLSTVLDMYTWKKIEMSEAAKKLTWLVVASTFDSLLSPQYYLPLDNQVTLAVWGDIQEKKGSFSGGHIQFWEVYQPTKSLPHRAILIGHYPLPPQQSPVGVRKSTMRDSGKESTNPSYPSENYAYRRINLTGLHLRCLTETWEPFTHNTREEETGEQEGGRRGGLRIGGFMGEMFNLLSITLNFTYTCKSSPDGEFGDFKSGRWSGLVGEVVEGRADIIVTILDSTPARSKVLDFCYPSGSNEYIIVIKKPGTDPWFSFTSQLRPKAWMMVVCFVVVATLAHLLLSLYSPFLNTSRPAQSWFTVQSLCSNQGDVNVDGVAGRIFTITIITTSFLLLAFYTSVFISSLTVPLFRLPFLNMQGLLKDGTYKVGLTKGSSEVERFRTSKDPTLQKVWSSLVSNLVENVELGLEKVLNESFAMVVEGNNFNIHYSSDCRFFPLPYTFFKYGGGMALAEGSPYHSVLNFHSFNQHTVGLVERSKIKYLRQNAECQTDAIAAGPIDMHTLITAFLFLGVMVVVSVVVLMIEIVTHRRSRKSRGRSKDMSRRNRRSSRDRSRGSWKEKEVDNYWTNTELTSNNMDPIVLVNNRGEGTVP
ncbi:hypothetical protein Pmani_039357 [Petrolisthes manimaculis]|uniref:Ionotropic glutamate receptor L-glutamate and glycine-binding domain-containing protein n=1 Tax=Petrolisthes manimaculis TaxID=1843537 RepID=A0AAE1NCZ4_9EUCA|nr:hypothetical protein Pmani_039357 [Petrolisthes manimaculis]